MQNFTLPIQISRFLKPFTQLEHVLQIVANEKYPKLDQGRLQAVSQEGARQKFGGPDKNLDPLGDFLPPS